MKSSKERKIDRKRKNKEMNVKKTEASRTKRLENKAKRNKIWAISPDQRVVIRDGITYDEFDNEIEVRNGNLHFNSQIELDNNIIEETIKFCNEPVETFTVSEGFDQKLQDKIDEIEEVKEGKLGIFSKLTKKLKGK